MFSRYRSIGLSSLMSDSSEREVEGVWEGEVEVVEVVPLSDTEERAEERV
jgi:hypothetical protein